MYPFAHGLAGLVAVLSTSVVCGGVLLSYMGRWVGCSWETGRANSLICILLLLRTLFGVFTKYEYGISAVDRTANVIDHFLDWGTSGLQAVWEGAGGSALAWVSYLL